MTQDDTSQSPTQVVQAQLDAYNQHDLSTFMRCYASDCRIEDGLGDMLLDGHAAIEARYSDLFAQAPHLRAEVTRRLSIGPYVIDEEHVTGLPAANGGERALDAIAIYRIDDGLIRHIRMLP
jgi:hypothetical protein